jgi:hypothetical protein
MLGSKSSTLVYTALSALKELVGPPGANQQHQQVFADAGAVQMLCTCLKVQAEHGSIKTQQVSGIVNTARLKLPELIVLQALDTSELHLCGTKPQLSARQYHSLACNLQAMYGIQINQAGDCPLAVLYFGCGTSSCNTNMCISVGLTTYMSTALQVAAEVLLALAVGNYENQVCRRQQVWLHMMTPVASIYNQQQGVAVARAASACHDA